MSPQPSELPHIALDVLRRAFHEYAGRIAVVSSFGADSALLLSMTAEIDRTVPVLFLETGQHFPETLAYRNEFAAALGLSGVRDIRPDVNALSVRDPDAVLYAFDPDACCTLRKTEPLKRALAPFAAWVTGRRKSQATTRSAMRQVEWVDGRMKFNPLADWTDADVASELQRRDLPRHHLVDQGYLSIGCAPCTKPAQPGKDPRSGRWAGTPKTECGIHRQPSESIS